MYARTDRWSIHKHNATAAYRMGDGGSALRLLRFLHYRITFTYLLTNNEPGQLTSEDKKTSTTCNQVTKAIHGLTD